MQTQVNTPAKSSKKFLIIALAAVLLIGGGAAVYAMMINTPKNQYLMAEYNTYEATAESFDNQFGDLMDLSEKAQKEANESDTRIGIDMDLGAMGATGMEAALAQSLLKSAEVQVKTQHDPKKEEGSFKLGVLMNDSEIAGAEFYQNNKQTAIEVPELYSKHVYFENKQFGDLMRKFDSSYVGLEEMQNFFKAYDSYLTDEDAREEMVKEYAEVLKDNIKDDNVTEKDADFNGESMKALTLTLSEKEVKDILVAYIEKIESDDKLINEIAKQSSLSGGFDTTMSGTASEKDTKKQILDGLKDVKKGIKEDVSMPKGFKQTVIINSDDVIVSRSFDFEAGPKDSPDEIVAFDYDSESKTDDNDKTKSSWKMVMTPKSGEGTFVFDMKMDSEPKGEGMKRDIKTKFEMTENGATDGAGFHIWGEGNKEKSKWNLEMTPVGDMAASELPDFKLQLEHKGKQDLDNDKAQHDFKTTIVVNDPSMGGEMKMDLNIKSKTTFTDKLKFPKLSGDNAVNAAEASDEEIGAIMQEVQMNIQNFIGENAQLFQGGF
ncbi:DUF6583 family protein [Fictibacillus aquaticus]|uniref:Uncharacterized protein n=1 Tax=Fictibacillus aquaticus TaxID=2021314 RepID=A0A235F8K8_9BACL|nr:DUF6583 family protein [Fictibacillus aquaticus]OYD57529.1 hypothetical protein CGZ90_12725 [Fictibacillus aquaticus]